MLIIDPSWSFQDALAEISRRYTPGSITGGPQRNRQIEAWGQIVGRTRALAELESTIKSHGSLSALGRAHRITGRTLSGLREFFMALPDDGRKARLYPGREFGAWSLIHRLGGTANADVWKARSGKRVAALKILRRTRGKSLERFRAEISILDRLGEEPGILPKLER